MSQIVCKSANKGGKEKVVQAVDIDTNTIYLRVQVAENAQCSFSYSVDNKEFTSIGETFTALPGQWIGAKMGFFINRMKKSNDAGYVDIDWFRVE